MDKLHAEMERTVSKTIDNKLVDYQISLSDNFTPNILVTMTALTLRK